MMKHNKKRNVGLLNEFFAQYMANAAVEFRFDDYAKASALWKKHFKKGTELSKELKMFETITNSNLSDRNVAYDLLKKIKTHVKEQNQDKLDREKTNLIHEIRYQLLDENFFDRQVDDYKTSATIQIVLNSWRTRLDEINFSQMSLLEEKIVDHMVLNKKQLPPFNNALLETSKEDIDRLVINVFREKVDNKYSEQLNKDQKEILGLFTFARSDSNSQKLLSTKLSLVKENVLKFIDSELSKNSKHISNDKLKEVKECVVSKAYNVDAPDEKTVTFYLSICSLKQELESE